MLTIFLKLREKVFCFFLRPKSSVEICAACPSDSTDSTTAELVEKKLGEDPVHYLTVPFPASDAIPPITKTSFVSVFKMDTIVTYVWALRRNLEPRDGFETH